jgi:hypothetical protein
MLTGLRVLLFVVVGIYATPAWATCTEVARGTGGSASETGAAVISNVNMAGANLIIFAVSTYAASPPTLGQMADSSSNTWTMTNYASTQDANSDITTYRVIAPTTSASQTFTFTPSGGVGSYPGAIVLGLSCSALPVFSGSVQQSLVHPQATMQAGSIGAAGQLVVALLYVGYDVSVSIDGGFATPVHHPMVLAQTQGTAASWKDVNGPVNPTWTPSPIPTPYIAVAEAFDVGAPNGKFRLRLRLP